MLSIYVATTNRALAASAGLRRKLGERSGVTAIEYGLIAGLIAVAIIAAVTLLGGNLGSTFNTVAGKLSNSGAL